MLKSNLIIVPCHSIWKLNSLPPKNLGQSADQWHLAPFQYEGNDHLAFIKHGLRAIVELLKEYNRSILLFSGSQTKKDAGQISEAQSYVFLMRNIIDYSKDNLNRLPGEFDEEIRRYITQIFTLMKENKLSVNDLFTNCSMNTEEFSLDSLDNLLYSICRFHEISNQYPKDISIIGFGFKKERFIKYHAHVIDFPKSHINYISIEPKPLNYSIDQLDKYFKDLTVMEGRNAINLFAKDWYGIRSPLSDKKQSRNPYCRVPNYELLKEINLDCSSDDNSYFHEHIKGKMPWSM